MEKQKLGWKRQLPDHRDHLFLAAPEIIGALPSKVDLRGTNMPEPYDQGRIGSCTANSIAGAIQYDRRKTGKSPDFVPSRLFIYYNERVIEKTTRFDAGANLRDGIKTIAAQGVCNETYWPYNDLPANPDTSLWPANAIPNKKPSAKAYKAALACQAVAYKSVQQNLNQIKAVLASGFVVVFGFSVFSNLWENGNPVTHLTMPGSNDRLEGGHAVLLVGFRDDTKEFIVRNSWGNETQEKGYFYMSYDYVTSNLASDFWVVTMMES